MIVAHGLVSSALFVLANLCYIAFQRRSLFLTKGVLCFSPLISAFWFIALAANMGAPPSVNLLREVIMVLGLSRAVGMGVIFIASLLFLSAAYCFHVFIATQHGNASHRFLSSFRISIRSALCLVLHLTPVFLLITKRRAVCC